MILITRHKIENKKLSILLKKKKISIFNESFIFFNHLNKSIRYKENKIFIVASAQAVKTIALKKNLTQINKSTFLAVGEKTKKQLKKLGLKVLISSPDGFTLFKEIKKRKLLKEKSFEYLCSNIYNKEFVRDLKKNGFKIRINIVYQTKAKQLMDDRLIEKLSKNKINTILFFSLFTMKSFFLLSRKHKVSKAALSQIKYICISKRIASYAIDKGFVTKWPRHPNQAEMIKLVTSLLK